MALSYDEARRALAGQRLPALLVDEEAFARNVAHVAQRAERGGVRVRVASKSVRVVELVRRALDGLGARAGGVLCYAAREAEALAGRGIDDLVVAYPVWQAADTEALARTAARGTRVAVALDDPAQVARVAEAARLAGTVVGIVVDVDMSTRAGGAHLGVRRSPLRTPDEVLGVARAAADAPGARFAGILAYEAQIAGLGDRDPEHPVKSAARRAFKAMSLRDVRGRRRAIVEALTDAGLAPEIVNGGGTGSIDVTTAATAVTEITVGSAFFKPHLFDAYDDDGVRALEVACSFALEVTRVPGPGFVTCSGGGYVASGAAGADRLPAPWLPEGLALLEGEGAGEVQTPLAVPRGVTLRLGAPVLFRHAKAGEVCERFDEALLVRGGRVSGRARTYRGEGWSFF